MSTTPVINFENFLLFMIVNVTLDTSIVIVSDTNIKWTTSINQKFIKIKKLKKFINSHKFTVSVNENVGVNKMRKYATYHHCQ